MDNKKLIIISVVISLAFIGFAAFFVGTQEKISPKDEANITLGELDSAHEHMTMLVFIDGARIDLEQNRYMLKDEYAHFEDDNGVVIHKHATGVTLPYFLSTLNIELTQNCITLDTGRQYCNSPLDDKILRVIINGKDVDDINTYELHHKDKILINYGDDSETELQLKFNNISNVPAELL